MGMEELTSRESASREGQCWPGTTLHVRHRSHCTHCSVSGSAAAAALEALLFGVGLPASDRPPCSAEAISCGPEHHGCQGSLLSSRALEEDNIRGR